MPSEVRFEVAKRDTAISGSTSASVKVSQRRLGIVGIETKGPLPFSWMVKSHRFNACACRRKLSKDERGASGESRFNKRN